MSRARKRRRNKQTRALRDADARYGPDQARIVYEFSDGWTIRQFTRTADAWREGDLMEHCLRADDRGPLEDDDIGHGHSLRDGRNYPHLTCLLFEPDCVADDKVSFLDDDRDTLDRLKAGERDTIGHCWTAGHGNREPDQKYLARLGEWLSQMPHVTAMWLEIPETLP